MRNIGRGVIAAVSAVWLLATLLAAPTTWASDERSEIGPKLGTALAGVTNFKDENGMGRDFASLAGKNGLVLIFSRSLSWCPYCMADARDWSDLSKEANSLGVRLAVATYDPVDVLERFARNSNAKIALLSDEGSRVIRDLGILNDEHGPGSFAHGIPHPMVLVLDASGILRHRFSKEHYSQRADKMAVLNAVRVLLER